MAEVRRINGNHAGAVAVLEEALGIYRDLGDRGGESEVLNEAGTLYLACGDLDRASAYHRQALDLANALSCSWDQAHALAGLSRCAQAAGDTSSARALLQQAQQTFRVVGAAEASEVAAELDALGE